MFLHLEELNPRHWDYPFCSWNTCYSECFGTPDIIWFYTIPWKLTLNLSEVGSPRRTLLEKDVCFHWGKPQDESFNTLKRRVCNTTCPAFLLSEKNPTYLDCRFQLKGPWCCFWPGRLPYGVWVTCLNQKSAELRSDWKGSSSHILWLYHILLVCIWSPRHRGKWL